MRRASLQRRQANCDTGTTEHGECGNKAHHLGPRVERNFGYAVARAYAGHTDCGSEAGATSTYVRASLDEVAAALAALTGERHPLATTEGW